MNTHTLTNRFIQFLKDELDIPSDCVAIALRQDQTPNLLPMILWQYGLVSLEQVDQMFDWLETA